MGISDHADYSVVALDTSPQENGGSAANTVAVSVAEVSVIKHRSEDYDVSILRTIHAMLYKAFGPDNAGNVGDRKTSDHSYGICVHMNAPFQDESAVTVS